MSLDSEEEPSNVVPVDFGGGAAGAEGVTVAKDANISERVLAEIRKEPRTVEQLAVACDATEKQVRNAVTALRRRYQSDSPDHVVSFKRQYWTAKELSRRGHVLEVTSKGTLKVVKSTKTGGKKKKPKAEKKPKKPKDQQADKLALRVHKLLKEIADDPDDVKFAVELTTTIVKAWHELQESEGATPRERKRARDLKAASWENLRAIMEEAVPGDADGPFHMQQNHSKQMAWQAYGEQLAEGIEIRKAARLRESRANDALAGIMEAYAQLELDFAA